MLFCDKLQQLRRNAKLTQDEFAAIIEISRQAISKWESGKAYPDLKKLQIICKFFNVSPDLLLNDKCELSDANEEYYPFDLAELGNHIQNVRIARGIRQENLAELLGVSRQSLSKWENGTVIPKTEFLIMIMKKLDTDMGELLPPALGEPHQKSPSVEGDTYENAENASVTVVPKRKKRLLPILIIPLAALLSALVAVGAILTIPMLNSDPFEALFSDLFFDLNEVGGIMSRWETEGVEITLGDGENIITAKTFS